MNPAKVRRDNVNRLEDLPNVGPASAADLRLLGITKPVQLVGKDPFALYDSLCRKTGQRHDPCVIDLFMSVVHFADGGDPLPWWHFTPERKQRLASR